MPVDGRYGDDRIARAPTVGRPAGVGHRAPGSPNDSRSRIRSRHGVVPAGRKRLAAQQPGDGEGTATHTPVAPHRGQRVGATGRLEPAHAGVAGRPAGSVEPHEPGKGPGQGTAYRAVGVAGDPRQAAPHHPGGQQEVDDGRRGQQHDQHRPGGHRPRPSGRLASAGRATLASAASSARPSSAELAVAASGSARTTSIVPGASVSSRTRTCSRNRRRTLLRTTAFPTRRPTTKPARAGSPLVVHRLWTTSGPDRVRRPVVPTRACSSRVRTREPSGSMTGKGYQQDQREPAVRRRARCGPYDGRRTGSRGPRESACAVGTRACGPADGCSAGRCAYSRENSVCKMDAGGDLRRRGGSGPHHTARASRSHDKRSGLTPRFGLAYTGRCLGRSGGEGSLPGRGDLRRSADPVPAGRGWPHHRHPAIARSPPGRPCHNGTTPNAKTRAHRGRGRG